MGFVAAATLLLSLRGTTQAAFHSHRHRHWQQQHAGLVNVNKNVFKLNAPATRDSVTVLCVLTQQCHGSVSTGTQQATRALLAARQNFY
jgi:hypothetical protein